MTLQVAKYHRAIAFVFLVFPLPSVAGELRSEEVVEATKAAIRRIGSIEGTFRAYFDDFDGEGIIKGPDGKGLFTEFRWGLEPRSAREYMIGKWGVKSSPGKVSYFPSHCAYDGKELRTWDESGRSGLIEEEGGHFGVWQSPSVLWGRMYTDSPMRDLDQLLEGAKLIDSPSARAGEKVLRGSFKRDVEDRQLTVWVDPSHGFLPRRIETVRNNTRTVEREVEVQEFFQTSSGVWIPVRGQVTNYYVRTDFKLPNGMTHEQLDKLPIPEADKILEKVDFQTAKHGSGTETVVLDTKDLSVNSPIPDEKFTIVYPEGAEIWDAFKKTSYVVKKGSMVRDRDAVVVAPSPRRPSALLIGLAATLAILIAIFAYRKMRRTSQSAMNPERNR